MEDHATKQDTEELKQDIKELKVEMFQRMDEIAAILEERIRDSQTELLRAVMSYQESNQQRMTSLETVDAAVMTRLALVEERVMKIDKRLGPPPLPPYERPNA